jgi:predicted dehydrogenase
MPETLRPIKLGIIGLGGIAQVVHLPILKQMSNVDVRVVCDLDKQKAGWVADRFGVPMFYRDPANVIEREDLDAIMVLTPTHAHMALAIAALKAGKHVLVEKPIARNLREAKRMVSTARDANRILMIAMNHRFRPDATKLKKVIDAGDLGDVFKVRSGWLKKKSKWTRSEWLTNPQISGGGVLMDLGIQMVDLCLWLLSKYQVKRISATKHQLMIHAPVEDTISIYMTLEGNVLFSLEVSWAVPTKQTVAFTYFYGTEGTATLNPLTLTKITNAGPVEVKTRQNYTPSELYQKSFELELEHFFKSIGNDTPVLSSGEEALKVMEIIETIYRSADEGREVIVGSS